MNLIEKIKAAEEAAMAVVEAVGSGGLHYRNLRLKPGTYEDAVSEGEKQFDRYGSAFFNQAGADRMAETLKEAGLVQRQDNHLVSDEWYRTFSVEGLSTEVHLHYKKVPTKEEECANLKARLAELGCHY